MKKADLVANISEQFGLSKKDCNEVLDLILSEITKALANGEKVSLVGFGTFSVKERAERTGVNPAKKGEKIIIPATKVPVFKAGNPLKEAVK